MLGIFLDFMRSSRKLLLILRLASSSLVGRIDTELYQGDANGHRFIPWSAGRGNNINIPSSVLSFLFLLLLLLPFFFLFCFSFSLFLLFRMISSTSWFAYVYIRVTGRGGRGRGRRGM